MSVPARRIPSLDGLRAISIVLVIFSHLLGTTNFPLGGRALGAAGDVGYLGVRVFFVISGYLITTLLLKEHGKTGTVSLVAFYARRAFRIFPAFYAFILAMAIAELFGAITLRDRDVVHALTYTMNYHYERSWELGHLWSLSIEEQFYLLWPALMLLCRPRWIGHVAIGMVVLAPLCRAAALFLIPGSDVIMEAYPCVMDAIAAGSVLAIAQDRLDRSERYQRFLASPRFLLVPALVIAAHVPLGVASVDYTIDISIENLGIALIVDRCVRVTRGPVFDVLNARPLIWLGTMSYSLYLWQEPFLNHYAHSTFTAWPINLVLALICAVASYHLVEKPFFALRDEWARRRRVTSPPPPPPP